MDGVSGPELRRRRPVFTVDLSFTITAASESTVELLNLMAAVATFLTRNRDIAMLRDPDQPELGEVQWEMEPDGDFRTNLRDQAGVRARGEVGVQANRDRKREGETERQREAERDRPDDRRR